ncbi:MAG TPA: hypothetical protein VFC09_12275 [Candidatus Dormibacteraeota bacterium]|nr:hypothetical protein [Candidatus Dormibacteraeota bacterium]
MTERDDEALQRAAAEGDPGDSAEDKAKKLTPELEAYAREQEEKERTEDLRGERAAPERAGEGVAEHEQEMAHRGFEKAGPPE